MSAAQVERLPAAIIRQAAQWMMRVGDAPDAATQAACEAWRQADARHELAWRRLLGIGQEVHAVTSSQVCEGVAQQTILRYCEQRSRRSAIKWMLGGVGLGSLAWAGAREGLWDGRDTYRTAIGEQRTLTLPDGTVLTMNTASQLSLRYDKQQRRVELREGEILLVTAPDPGGRPFSVQTPNGLITPLGTRFAVRHEGSRQATQVAVFAGAVRVEPGGHAQAARVVLAGEQTAFDARAVQPASAVEGSGPAWQAGMLVANRMRLDVFLAELGRYRAGVLRCAPEVAGREVSGAFRVDDTDRALEVVAEVLGLALTYRTRYWVSLAPA